MLVAPDGVTRGRSDTRTPLQRLRAYQPLVQSMVHVHSCCGRRARSARASRLPPTSSLHATGLIRCTESFSHTVGAGCACSSDPVAARLAPRKRSKVNLTATAPAESAARRRNACRVRSPCRRAIGRRSRCTSTSGTSRSANVMCQPWAVRGPTSRTPSECATPNPSRPTAQTAPASESSTCGQRRRSPRRITPSLLQTSRITAMPVAPCAQTTRPALPVGDPESEHAGRKRREERGQKEP